MLHQSLNVSQLPVNDGDGQQSFVSTPVAKRAKQEHAPAAATPSRGSDFFGSDDFDDEALLEGLDVAEPEI